MKEIINYFNSPFIRPRLRFYFGKVKIGVPYFLPGKRFKDPNTGQLKHTKKIIGFDYCKLRWKTKWKDTDFRFESSPIFSFVFFGLQIAITIDVKRKNIGIQDHYWEAWLYYHNATDKNKRIADRVKDCINNFPQTYIVSKNGQSVKIDYYEYILKKKYRPVSLDEKRDSKLKSLVGNV
jgi:hypothetical protein